jgi:hypothetical protein
LSIGWIAETSRQQQGGGERTAEQDHETTALGHGEMGGEGKEKQRRNDRGDRMDCPNPLGWGLVAKSELGATMAAPARKGIRS